MCKDACGCSPQAVVWDSGVINEPNVSLICYAGSQLKPRTRYDWILTLWDMHGNCVDSEVCWFETGKCREAWTAKWISAPGIRLDRNDAPALYLRRKFGLGAAVKSARMYICGLGLYEVFVDNAPVSDSLLEPAYTKYDAFALYRVYDITSFLTQKDYAAVGAVWETGGTTALRRMNGIPRRPVGVLLRSCYARSISSIWMDRPNALAQTRHGPCQGTARSFSTRSEAESGTMHEKKIRNGYRGKQIIGRGRLQSVSAALAERFARRRMTRSVSRRRSHLFRQESRQRVV